MKKKVLSLFMILTMVMSFTTTLPFASAADEIPDLWKQAGVVTLAQGNIARTGTTTRQHSNGSNTGVTDGVIPTAAGSNHWNTWGAPADVGSQESPVWAQVEWTEPYRVEGTRVMWHIFTDTGVRWPNAANIQYRDDNGNWVPVFAYTPQPNSSTRVGIADPNSPIGVDGKSGTSVNRVWPAPSRWASNGVWNIVKFPAPVTTTAVRLLVYGAKNGGSAPGIGVGEWEVFGARDPAAAAVKSIDIDFIHITKNLTLPLTHANGTTFEWSVSPADGALTKNGTITRPAIGQDDATGTITVVGTNGTQTYTRTWDYSVLPYLSDSDMVERDYDALILGDTTKVTSDLTLPTVGDFGSSIKWSVDSPYLRNDGTVIRPPSGANATVKLTATITSGSESQTKEFDIVIVAYKVGGRAINIVKTAPDGDDLVSPSYVIPVPVRTSPKLPYRVWVEYTDGYAEWRNTQWPWSLDTASIDFGPAGAPGTMAGIEQIWQGYPVGKDYTVTGWITGDNATAWGYPITVNCKVVEGDFTMPKVNGIYTGGSNTFTTVAANPASLAIPESKVAKPLAINKVSLDSTNPNRLTSNVTRSVVQAATASIWDVPIWIYNYRDSFNLPVGSGTGYTTQPSGWESPTTKLRGHGAGHYIDALALTYNTGASTPANREIILNKIKRFVKETREIQEMTFYPLDWEGKLPNQTYEDIKAAGKTYKDLKVTKWREAADTWPYNATDKAQNAPNWPYATLDQVTSSWDAFKNPVSSGEQKDRTRNLEGARDPEWFGYGYIHATPPIEPILSESYGSYSAWLWAPYYSVHKQLAGFMDCYYAFKDSTDPELKDVADTAFAIAKDMSHWISNRLTTKAFIGERKVTTEINPKIPSSTFGNMNYQWSTNISGEYGGVNESIARVATELPDGDPEKDLLKEGMYMFYNKSYWDPLAANSELMSLTGNSHANSRIPNFPGALWMYSLNKDPYFYVVAKNFFDFNNGRYRYYGGNVGDGEWYKAPYTQIANLAGGQINETCCAMNLCKLSKDLASYDPDNAAYYDYYERLTFNQLIGSVRQSGGSWGVTYQYAVGPNTDKPFGNTDPGSTCCGGTGVENPSRYIESVYLANNDTIWVNMMVPVIGTWDATGYTIAQDCSWPSETSTITMTPIAGQNQKPAAIKIRVPWWATKNVSIKLNGVEVAAKYLASSFVEIPARVWTANDKIELSMPFQTSIDYAPDKSNNMWAGTIFYGPLAMTGTGSWSTQNIESDLSNIEFVSKTNRADTATNTPGNNNNIYTLSVTGEQDNTNAATLTPDYYRDTAATKYFRINIVGLGGADRSSLFNKLQEAFSYKPAQNYEANSYADLLNAIMDALVVYQDDSITQVAVDAQTVLLQAAIDKLIPNADGKGNLKEAIEEAKRRKAAQEAWEADPNAAPDAKPYAPYGFARMLTKLTEAIAVYENNTVTQGEVNAALAALKNELNTMRIGNQYEVENLDGIKALLEEIENLDIYKTQALNDVVAYAKEAVEVITVGGSTMSEYPPTAVEAALRAAIAALNISIDARVVIQLVEAPNEKDFNLKFAMTAAADLTVNLFYAEYDPAGVLLKVERAADVKLDAGVEKIVDTTSITIGNGNSYRFFIWDGSYKPLTGKTEAASLL